MKKIISLTLIGVLLFATWYFFIALKPVPMSQTDILSAYEYQGDKSINLKLAPLEDRNYEFTFKSFDGQEVTGQIAYPETISRSYPVLLGIPAMGRSYVRWFVESFKGRPTLTQVNKIAEAAKKKGYVVISIDSRYHGKRKDPDKTLRSIMLTMDVLGNKTDYQAMIKDTVLDYRMLLDWIDSQEQLDSKRITVAGYSMGGQVALLLSSIDNRIAKTISIVPPFIDDKVALVAPVNVVNQLTNERVLLLTADDDENASVEQNNLLHQRIGNQDKKQVIFKGGHVLPPEYISSVAGWL